MATRDERDILTIIDEEGEDGALSEVKISKFMGLRLDYIRAILDSMGRRDLIDYKRSGRCEIVDRGWKALGKTPLSRHGDIAAGTNLEPKEKYEKWLTGNVSEETKKELHHQEDEEGAKDKLERKYDNIPPEERFKIWAGKGRKEPTFAGEISAPTG